MDGFAIIPDDTSHPTALFADLNDAINWAIAHLGDNRFTVRHMAVVTIAPNDPKPARD